MEASKIRVVIVEDEPFFLEEFMRIIQASPEFTLAGTATSVKAGCNLVRSMEYDVLLCDLGLPDGSGTEIIRLGSEVKPNAVSMVVSLFGDEERVVINGIYRQEPYQGVSSTSVMMTYTVGL